MAPARFPIRLGERSRPLLRIFGATASNSYVAIDGLFDAHFGFFHVTTPLGNVARWQIEGPWLWITAIGVRMSIRHRDLTFGGNNDGGVRVDFRERVRIGPLRIPALYVTVADLEEFAAALSEKGIPGQDARRQQR